MEMYLHQAKLSKMLENNDPTIQKPDSDVKYITNKLVPLQAQCIVQGVPENC